MKELNFKMNNTKNRDFKFLKGKVNKKILNLFSKQIETFNDIKNYNISVNNYKIGDKVILNKDTLIHGSRVLYTDLEKIKECGLIAPEFVNKKIYKNKKKPFVTEFWHIRKKISLKEFINTYCGFTINVSDKNGNVINRVITSYDNLEHEIMNLKDYRDYIIVQNQEQRFLPNKYNKNSTVAFIINYNIKLNALLKNDIFNDSFNKKILSKIIPKWFYNKYFKVMNYDNYETGRERTLFMEFLPILSPVLL